MRLSPEQPAQCGGTLILHFGDRQDRVVEALQAARVAFDARRYGLRLSPHIYNTTAEMDTVKSCFG